jgi:Zn-dependent oligopeptidase
MFTSSDLDGLQDDYLKARVTENGSYQITLKYPDFMGIMEYCKVRETRKVMSTAFSNRCVNENMELVLQIFKLRKEMANLLGYSQYSDMTLEKKMAKNTETVMTFLNSLKQKAKDPCMSDIQKLSKLAESMGDDIDNIELWDIPYYSRIYKELNTYLTDEELKKYFPLDVVTNGMFQIYQTLLGLQFNNITSQHKEKLWHDDVTLFEVVDSTSSQLVGHFFLDLFPRDGKYGHAAVFPFVTKSCRNLPVASMACNFSKEGNLKFSEVETYFHEFGHVMHGMCSNTKLSKYGGTNCERDFVEAPSQMLEEWCYKSVSLKMMSAGITDDVIKKINLKRDMLQGYFNARQVCFGLYDMVLHSAEFDLIVDSVDPVTKLAELYDSIVFETVGIRSIPNTNMIASFGHLFGGYASGYYGYLYSKVYSKDMFVTKFLDHELDPVVGAAYRKEILSYGGSRPSLESLRVFLEREPNDVAFMNSLMSV